MKWKKLLIIVFAGAASIFPAKAQYGEIVNGLTNVALPAIRGGAGYKGYLEGDFTKGVGEYRTNFVTLATSQGYMLTDWCYMGAGIGVDLLWSKVDDTWGNDWVNTQPQWKNHEHTSTAVMIPVFTDLRFIMGEQTDIGFFINLRFGAAFLCTDSYVQIRDGYLTNRSYFYMQPALGMRVPVNKTKPRQAIDIGLHYRLMTSNYWSGWQHSATINGLGLNISYEW